VLIPNQIIGNLEAVRFQRNERRGYGGGEERGLTDVHPQFAEDASLT